MAQAFLFFQARGAGEMHGRTNGTSWPFSLPGVISAGVLYGFVYAACRVHMTDLPRECGTVLTSGGFEPPANADALPPALLKALRSKNPGPRRPCSILLRGRQ